MLYHPHFCCHCGEKIVRAKWTPMTSRRFCEFCAVEQKQHDLIPRAAAVILLLFGAAGFTAYLSSGKSSAVSDLSQAPKIKALKPEQREPGIGDTCRSSTPGRIQEPLTRSQSNISAAENKQPAPT